MDTASHRPPLQARSRRTLARITEAGLALLSEGGPATVTVQGVIARARVSVGSFYARFEGRDELLAHLIVEAAARERTRWEGELEKLLSSGEGLDQRVRAVVGLLISLEADLGPDAHVQLQATAARVLLECRREIRHPQPEAALEMGYAAVRGAARHPPPAWPEERVRDELARLWLSYLGGSTTGAGDAKGGVDFFHVWA